MAIINAIEMQLESRDTESDVVRLLADSMAALAAARPISERDRRTLEERLADFVERGWTTFGKHRTGSPSCPATIRSNGASSNPPSSSSAFGGTCGMP